MSPVLFWDIDGTLLTTARAGVFALEDAAHELGADEAAFTGLVTAGLTDAEVAALCLETCGLAAGEAAVDRFLRAYERHLPAALQRKQGRVLPGVREVLDDLSGRDDVVSLLLTGNTPAGARVKLAHYGLLGYFAGGGAFCEGGGPREDIAHRARALADGADTLIVIGDTPHDVRCGRAIGARVVGVATGAYGVEQLEAAGASIVIVQFPGPGAFRALLGIA